MTQENFAKKLQRVERDETKKALDRLHLQIPVNSQLYRDEKARLTAQLETLVNVCRGHKAKS